MTITLQCPRLSCKAVLQVPDKVRGKRVRCGHCGNTFIVPSGLRSNDDKSDQKSAAHKT
ncbi:MAG: MJ0042-type zinc finger domain-containing protein [Planctomycetota bacterium]|jgi:predicted Zn finger-like uncharacterized protein